jgi:hypothetical protein
VQVLNQFYPVFLGDDDYFEGDSHCAIVTDMDLPGVGRVLGDLLGALPFERRDTSIFTLYGVLFQTPLSYLQHPVGHFDLGRVVLRVVKQLPDFLS